MILAAIRKAEKGLFGGAAASSSLSKTHSPFHANPGHRDDAAAETDAGDHHSDDDHDEEDFEQAKTGGSQQSFHASERFFPSSQKEKHQNPNQDEGEEGKQKQHQHQQQRSFPGLHREFGRSSKQRNSKRNLNGTLVCWTAER